LKEAPEQNAIVLAGTFASQDPLSTTNNSVTSAKTLGHIAENWFAEYVNHPSKSFTVTDYSKVPQYTPKDKRISVWDTL